MLMREQHLIEGKWRWGKGEWVDEFDSLEFLAHGLACAARRDPHQGFWTGLVEIPCDCSLSGAEVRAIIERIDVYGGGNCFLRGARTLWVEFKCNRDDDFVPQRDRHRPEDAGQYRNQEFVVRECVRVARQIMEG